MYVYSLGLNSSSYFVVNPILIKGYIMKQPEFNSCAHLSEDDAIIMANRAYDSLEHADPLQVMIDMQRSLQKKLAKEKPEFNPDPDELHTAGEVLDWMRQQDDSMDDEIRELYTSLGQMSNGNDASAVWKRWKSRHGELRAVRLDEMSKNDLDEIKYELVDQFHFFLNKLLGLGFTSRELFVMYYLKNTENFRRQENNY